MDVIEAIKTRHSYRGEYLPDPVPREDLVTIMEAGLAAPSGCNMQTTSLVAVDDPEMLVKVSEIIGKKVGATAPAMICVLTQRLPSYHGRCFAVQDYSAAIENMLLAIVALGYESCWVEGYVTNPDGKGRQITRLLGVPDEYELVCCLPVGVAKLKEGVDMRKILIVIDMQNDFIDAALGTKEAVAIVDAVKEKIMSYPAADVIATMDTHGENYMETQEGQNLPVMHCIKGTDGWQIRPDIAELLKEATIYEKPTFGSVKLAEDLKALAEKEEIELELIGLCTDICVVSNALLLKAAMPEVRISVDSSCCAGVTPEKHLAALETMRSCQIYVR